MTREEKSLVVQIAAEKCKDKECVLKGPDNPSLIKFNQMVKHANLRKCNARVTCSTPKFWVSAANRSGEMSSLVRNEFELNHVSVQ